MTRRRRLLAAVLATAAACGYALACEIVLVDPGTRFHTLDVFTHAMTRSFGFVANPVDGHHSEARNVWPNCRLAIEGTDIVDTITVNGKDQLDSTVLLGDLFFYTRQANWDSLVPFQVSQRRSSRFRNREMGVDAFYSQIVRDQFGQVGGVTQRGLNRIVMKADPSLDNRALAHEVGHTLSLKHVGEPRPDTVTSGIWLMQLIALNMGDSLTGMNDLARDSVPPDTTECGIARKYCLSAKLCLGAF